MYVAQEAEPTRRRLGKGRLTASVVLAVAIIAAGCGQTAPRSEQPKVLVAEVASFDLSPDRAERFIVGLFAADRGDVSLGAVNVSFEYIGPMDPTATDIPTPTAPPAVRAEFLALPGSATVEQATPTFDPPAGVRGVYGTEPIHFDAPGIWETTVVATVDGVPQSATAVFEVFEESLVPGPGEAAPRTVQPLPGDPTTEPKSIDSRLEFEAELPDPLLHQRTIASAIDAGSPFLVVVATPVFCVSRYCGPITDEIDRLASEYGQQLDFVHLEVWADFEANQLERVPVIGPGAMRVGVG